MGTRMNRFKPLLALILVFVAGVIVGTIGTRMVVRRVVREALIHPEKVRERVEKDMFRRLKLDAEQQRRIDVIMMDTQNRLRELRRQNQPQFFAIMSNAQAQISTNLTPEQRKAFDKYREENRRFFPPR
jgi:Spy/CpxP family protein refolding chaperone